MELRVPRKLNEIVLGKYLAVTRIDGGTLRLTEQERNEGWWTADAGRVFQGTSWGPPEYKDDWKVAYSPLITSIHGLPNETHDECCAGFDEWYVFGQAPAAGEIETFVNLGGAAFTIRNINGARIDFGIRWHGWRRNHT